MPSYNVILTPIPAPLTKMLSPESVTISLRLVASSRSGSPKFMATRRYPNHQDCFELPSAWIPRGIRRCPFPDDADYNGISTFSLLVMQIRFTVPIEIS
ncbi:hypothetical protein VIGAN_08059500 [Vigna angularis var. angularis]|uniref:Uncharacterized protein n=1 Tax=Vigna angularis var. angularis TaxID=157739 RepID=A0A0S3SME6_PHAAN|nr:hypothetical protein VIGAN_08059500 [Vigna angularis var. angularis]